MTSTVAIIGAGVIGAGWAARFLLNGWDVRVFDPDPSARDRVEKVLAAARLSLPGLGEVALPPEGRLSFPRLISEAVRGAGWVQESVPERIELKHKIIQAVQSCIEEGAILASSTSGFTATELQSNSSRPDQILVAHPFNPVYLLPLVEVVASDRTDPDLRDRAVMTLTDLGMAPLQVRAEVPAHIADRLLEAVWREALWLVKDGVATTGEIDDAIRMGFGLRWAQMGLFETYRIAGGDGGMAHFLHQFGPALKWPWSKLTDVPEMDDTLVATIAAQSDEQAGGRTIADLERQRDHNLVGLIRALGAQGWGAGAIQQAADERRMSGAGVPARFEDITDPATPVVTLHRAVPLDWIDYNGHMTEDRYLHAFGDASDRLMKLIGCDLDYVAAGKSFFTVESHIRHLKEVTAGAPLRIETRVIAAGGKKMHVWHEMKSGDRLLATAEHMLLHVDLETRRSAPLTPLLAERLATLVDAQAELDPPEGLSRAIGDPI
ncbi:3-hydroxybutyryl-CoA dehydrogenase [Pseudooceanicola batsensis HTCC2597]|uniref:L-carnitine dehydrogenase n=1 Tax=Pseudooceanicola batsensis (strain ATCC BAA-863 / DSM 15984 / KCTC 12145 / HTCC2597) TaxID=252305 RepID=A3U1X8_PSEBH|nr:carnitine 3-dehydrogenase [Pseudooceanicola batsensis]EAQ01912.1 3-hydroxybutyryl-CoA dehydrogenase [Pseudooceanicola batsensis HTCC2597]